MSSILELNGTSGSKLVVRNFNTYAPDIRLYFNDFSICFDLTEGHTKKLISALQKLYPTTTQDNEAFEVGDLVQLKCGGPVMLVSDTMDDRVDCTWFTKNHELEVRALPRLSLRHHVATPLSLDDPRRASY